jgi:hypothetical protein
MILLLAFSLSPGVFPATTSSFTFGLGDVGKVFFASDVNGRDVYVYSATIADTTLSAGSYLLLIVNNTPGAGDTWFWATSNQLGTSWFRSSDGEPWAPESFELAFNISGTFSPAGVPDTEASALLLGLGFIAVWFFRRVLSHATP